MCVGHGAESLCGCHPNWHQNSGCSYSESRGRWRERAYGRAISTLESIQSLLVLLELARVVSNQVVAIISCFNGFLSEINVEEICCCREILCSRVDSASIR